MTKPLRVGLVGANPDRSWAMLSHLPAISKLPGLKLTAVATSRAETAQAAGTAFGVDEYYSSAAELAASPNVDIVSVCVKVPYHAEIIRAALAQGKHVLCEWPLALSASEAEALRDEGLRAGVHCGVGLQARLNPAVRRAHDIIASGAIGKPLTVSVSGSTEGHGPALPSAYAYLCEDAKGATMSTILTGHALDTCVAVLGGLREVQALTTIKWPHVQLTDRDGYVVRDTPDYLSIQGRFANGAVLNAELDGGRPGNTPFSLEIVGTQGSLTLSGCHPYGFQASELSLESPVPHDPPEAPAAPGLAGPTANVGEVYARFAEDIRTGEHRTPDFVHAAKLHRLIETIKLAAASGQRQVVEGGPEN